MMVYKLLSILLALSFLAGNVAAQAFADDYTLTDPEYTATIDNGSVVFTGDYTILQAHTPELYTQVFGTVTNDNKCSEVTVDATPQAVTFTVSPKKVSAKFTLPSASLISPVYVKTTDTAGKTTGVVKLCHRLEITKNTLLVNVVDTIITATVDLMANFVAVTIETSAVTTGTVGTAVALTSTVTAAAAPTGAISAGKPITITVTSVDFNIDSIKANFKNGFNVIPKDAAAPLLVSTPSCTLKVCTFTLNLGIDFFRSGVTGLGPKAYELEGTATLVLGTGSAVRRQLQDQKADAPFSITFYEASDDASSSAVGVTAGSARMITLTMAAGSFMAAMAVV